MRGEVARDPVWVLCHLFAEPLPFPIQPVLSHLCILPTRIFRYGRVQTRFTDV